MWGTFWADVLVAVIGAVLTVVIAAVTYVVNVRTNERRALQSLINELHARRAFTGQPAVIQGAHGSRDFESVRRSVLSIRDEVRRARDRVRPQETLEGPLNEMVRACNRYLTGTNREPEHYAVLILELRDELYREMVKLAGVRRGIQPLRPGDGAY